jgi:hypothetical protein
MSVIGHLPPSLECSDFQNFIFKFYFGLLDQDGSLWNVLFWRTSITHSACSMSVVGLVRVGYDKRVDWVIRVVWGMLVSVDLF